eukprot:408472_1
MTSAVPTKLNIPFTTIKLVNWNLNNFGKNEEGQEEKDKAKMNTIKRLAKADHDVIVFEEVETRNEPSFDHLKKPFIDSGYAVVTNEAKYHAVVIFVRQALYNKPQPYQGPIDQRKDEHLNQITYLSVRHYCSRFRPAVDEAKIAGVHLNIAYGQTVFVFATHLKKGKEPENALKRASTVGCIRHMMQHVPYIRHAAVKIVIGDMNTEAKLPFWLFTVRPQPNMKQIGTPEMIDQIYSNWPIDGVKARPSVLSDHKILLARVLVAPPIRPIQPQHLLIHSGPPVQSALQETYGDYYDAQFEYHQLQPLTEPYDYNNGQTTDIQFLVCILLFALICCLLSAAYAIGGCLVCFVGYDASKKQTEMKYELVVTQP